MRSSTFQNVLNILIAIIAALLAFDWSVLFTPETGGAIIGVLTALKVAMNALRSIRNEDG